MRKLKKDIHSLIKTNVGLGIGTSIAASLPGGSTITPAFSAMGGMMPIVSTTVMGSHALRLSKNLMPKVRRRRKR